MFASESVSNGIILLVSVIGAVMINLVLISNHKPGRCCPVSAQKALLFLSIDY